MRPLPSHSPTATTPARVARRERRVACRPSRCSRAARTCSSPVTAKSALPPACRATRRRYWSWDPRDCQSIFGRALDVDRMTDRRAEQRQLWPTADRRVRVTSTDALRPRSASSGRGIGSRVSPAASVSSVSGVGAKEPGAERHSARPAAAAQQRRHARAEERADTRCVIDTRARGDRQPRRHVDVVLHEHAGNGERVGELRHVAAAVTRRVRSPRPRPSVCRPRRRGRRASPKTVSWRRARAISPN